jgi:DNA-binding transcriptional regulator GbsR (MarR family)
MRPSEHPAVQEFLDRFSTLMEPEGLPRPAGRMLGLFFAEGGEQTAEELARRLQISRSNVSTTVRVLESLGVVERTRRPGERHDRFRLYADPFVPMLRASVLRAARMRDMVGACRAELPPRLREASDRLAALQAFFGHAAGWLAQMEAAWVPPGRPRA